MEILLRKIIFCIIVLLDIVVISILISYIISLFKIDITKFEISSNKIPKEFNGFKILQLSDLHNKNFNKKLVERIEKQEPDIIVITGDMVSSNSLDFKPFFSLINQISPKYPTYYIFGNHEQRLSKEIQDEIIKLNESGVKILNNNEEIIKKEGKYIKIYGLLQNLIYYNNYLKNKETYSFEEKEMIETLEKPDEEIFNILLSHNPLYFKTYEKWGADLVFSGHVHGGIIRFPGGGGLLSPERKLFPEYSGGEYTINNSKMIVSRGLGYSTINLRIFNNPEICVVELKSNV